MTPQVAELEGPRPPRRSGGAVDASMDLLNEIMRHPVDPDYSIAAARAPRPHRRWPLTLVVVMIGAMLAVAALQTTRSAPAVETERRELISRIQAREAEQDRLRARVDSLSVEMTKLRSTAMGTDATTKDRLDEIARLELAVGNSPVTGPGVLITVDDAPGANRDARDRVLDTDLQMLANGLWKAGAEAIAINGHRLSSLTAIRSAGDAITVDYRSLTRPYEVHAIGDPRTLEARFVESSGGAWWNELAQNRRMRYEIERRGRMVLSADPAMVLRHARRFAA
jgi:uncharacterized protein YlxW (UPF0749 family)